MAHRSTGRITPYWLALAVFLLEFGTLYSAFVFARADAPSVFSLSVFFVAGVGAVPFGLGILRIPVLTSLAPALLALGAAALLAEAILTDLYDSTYRGLAFQWSPFMAWTFVLARALRLGVGYCWVRAVQWAKSPK